MADDLTKPLGLDKKPKRRIAMPASLPRALIGALGLCLLTFLFWATTADDPMGGEPVAAAAVEPAAKAAPDARQQVKVATPLRSDGSEVTGTAAGSRTVTIIDGTSGKRDEITIPAAPAPSRAANASAAKESAAVIHPRLIETSRHGGIPKIGPDGAKPSEVYARPVKVAAGKPDGPRIAIVVSGLGIGMSGTADALAKLPSPVTFAWRPTA